MSTSNTRAHAMPAAAATVHCDCGTTHHVTVGLDEKTIEAAVQRVITDMTRQADLSRAGVRARLMSGGRDV